MGQSFSFADRRSGAGLRPKSVIRRTTRYGASPGSRELPPELPPEGLELDGISSDGDRARRDFRTGRAPQGSGSRRFEHVGTAEGSSLSDDPVPWATRG
jgi:hypothetical protein